jgi:hypothetical protein
MKDDLALYAATTAAPLRTDQHERLAHHHDAYVRMVWSKRADQPASLAVERCVKDPKVRIRAALLSSPAVDGATAYQRRNDQGWWSAVAWALRPDAADEPAAEVVASLPERRFIVLLDLLVLSCGRGIAVGERPQLAKVVAERSVYDNLWVEAWLSGDVEAPTDALGDVDTRRHHLGAWHHAVGWARREAAQTVVDLYGTETGEVLGALLSTSRLSFIKVAEAAMKLCPHPRLAELRDEAIAVGAGAWNSWKDEEPF